MKIYFCDGCNESIPLGEIQAGRVTTIQGKLFCSTCIPPGAVLSPSAPPGTTSAPAASARGVWIVLLILLGWTAWRDRDLFLAAAEPPVTSPDAAPERNLPAEVQDLAEGLVQLEADGNRRTKDVLSLRADLESLRETDADLRRAFESQKSVLDRVALTQAETGRFYERMEISFSRLEVMETRLDALSDAVMAHESILALGEEGWIGVGSGGGAAPTSQPEVTPVDPGRAALVEEIRRQLLSPDPGVRFEGVDRIDAGAVRELAPELVTLLRDADMFVRMHAMKVIGDFGHEEAVPALFDVLEDDNTAIRKTAAENLVRLTGYDPGFDPKGTSGDRARAVKKWREWYAAR